MAKLTAQINADASQFLDVIKAVLKSAEEAQKAIQKAFGESSDIKIDDTAFKQAISNIEKSIKDLPDADIDVDIENAKGKINDIGKGADVAGKKAGKEFSFGFNDILKGTLAVSALQGLGGIARDAVSGFVDLNKNVANIGTLGVENFEQFTNLALEASKVVPDSAANIAAGAYQAISAGITGTNEEIIAFTQTASKVATAGLATTEEAVNGLTSVLNAYGKTAGDVGEASDTFFAAIKLGKTSFNELNAGLANVIPAASAAGISFEEVAGNIAQITALGVPTAQATTQLRSAIIELQKPGAELAKVMGGVTVEIDGVKQTLTENNIGQVLKQQGLTATLQQIEEAASASGKTLTQAFSSSEAASAALLLTGENAERANETLKNVRKEIEGGVSGKAYEVAAQSIDAQLQLLTNNAQAVFSQIFDALTPVVSAVLEGLNPIIQSVGFVIDNFDKLAIGIGIGAAAFGAYTLATSGAAIATSAAATATGVLNAVMALNPAVAIAAGIGALVVAGLALADAFSDTTEELLDANKAEQDLLAQKKETLIAQKSQIEGNRDLIAEYEKTGLRIEELRKKENLSKKEKDELTGKTKLLKEQQLKLNDVYPDAIKGTKSFAENLKSVKEETGLQNANLSKLSDNTKKLITDFEELGKKENKSAEEKKRLKEITAELALEFPKAGISSEDFAGSLSRVKDAAGLTFKQLDNVNGAITKLGLQQKKLQNEEINLNFRLNQEEIEGQIDDISTDVSLNLVTRGLNRDEFEIAEYVKGLKENIQSTWDENVLGDKKFDLLNQLSDKLQENDVDAKLQLSIRASFLKFFELQSQRIALNKKTQDSEIEAGAILEETAKKSENTTKKIAETTKEIADLSNFAKDLQGTKSILFDAKTDFEFGNLTIEEALDFFNNGVALTGDVTILNEIDKELEKIQLKKDTLVESEQFIQLQIDGTDKVISDLSSVRNETDKVLKSLEGKKLDLINLASVETDPEVRTKLLKQVEELNNDIIEQTIKTSTKSNLTREQLTEISNKKIEKSTKDNTEKLNDELSKAEQQLLDTRLKLTDKTDRDIQKLRLENSIQTQEVLKQLETLELQDRLAAELNEYKGNAEAQLIIKQKYIKLFSDLDKKYAVTTVDLYEDLAKKIGSSFSNFDATKFINTNKDIEKSINGVKKKYTEDTEALKKELDNKKISYQEYNEKVLELETTKNEKLKQLEADRVGFIDILYSQLSDSLGKLAIEYQDAFKIKVTAVLELNDKLKDLQKQFEDGAISETQYAEETTKAQLDKEEALQKSYEQIGVASGLLLGQMLADGESFTTALAQTALAGLQQLVPVFIAEIFGSAIATLGPIAGPIAAGLLTATLQALVGTAQAGIGGANDGVIGLNESNKGKPKGADSILMMLAPNESVITAQGTAKNKPYLEFINKGGNIADLITPNVSINPKYANGTSMDETNKRLDETNRRLDVLSSKFGSMKVNHFHDKQPTVNVNNTIEIKSQRGRL